MAVRQVCNCLLSVPILLSLFHENIYLQARALYDFDAEPGTGEVSIRVGDVLTITRTDVGEGWWEGRTPGGDSGLFPEAYVEEMSLEEGGGSAPPAMAPPPLPPDYGWTVPSGNTFNSGPALNSVSDDWDDPWGNSSQQQQPQPAAPQQQQQDWNADVSIEKK